MFKYLILLDPLGFLYGSSGPFLSPENLVGLASQTFPPQAPALAGLVAHALSETLSPGDRQPALSQLFVAGPFWSFKENPQNFCVPTPFCYLATTPADQITAMGTDIQPKTLEQLQPQFSESDPPRWLRANGHKISGKFDTQTWMPIQQWKQPHIAYGNPWINLPHLHPRLETDQRRVVSDEEQGSLFLENAVQLNPQVCLAYLSNTPIPDGWYRFGGEGHLVQLTCLGLARSTQALLSESLGQTFATLTPAIWGSNRFSLRYPPQWDQWEGSVHLWTDRATSFRFRLGGEAQGPKRLSRGRYAVSAGTVYHLPQSLEAWENWPYSDHPAEAESPIDAETLEATWFPTEGYSFKHWGCGLALPLNL
ncbi:type III-B CRISPR module-associated Cmr3 family protein [Lyngbya confervoides]|uniref:CRISPR-associated protein Cmr3 n=1 Tax=Lyngbya confervoides BDU141951 TaxID=1574623 RepID=A0ABD4T5V8_9CYAN|nr:CRISPR-associated protein Cmr3 [Lyngbya confervoides]MCM1983652.1 CRISPR-associated protein Cmr3 [Lyngbya confervoides BDU141951]